MTEGLDRLLVEKMNCPSVPEGHSAAFEIRSIQRKVYVTDGGSVFAELRVRVYPKPTLKIPGPYSHDLLDEFTPLPSPEGVRDWMWRHGFSEQDIRFVIGEMGEKPWT